MGVTLLTSKSTAPPSREEYAYNVLRDAILSGEFLPNQTVNQNEIARQLGISVIPVRAAISSLVAEGLMVQDAHRSARVSSFSPQELREILTIRMQLERLAIQEAIQKMDEATLDELRKLLDVMRDAAIAKDSVTFGRLNRRFHLAIYRRAEMPLLYEMIEDLWQKSDLHQGRTVFKRVEGRMRIAQAQHEQLFEYLVNRDIEAAPAFLLQHKREAMESFMETFDV